MRGKRANRGTCLRRGFGRRVSKAGRVQKMRDRKHFVRISEGNSHSGFPLGIGFEANPNPHFLYPSNLRNSNLPANRRRQVPLLALFPAGVLAEDKRAGDEFDFMGYR